MLQDYVNLQRPSESAFVIESSILFAKQKSIDSKCARQNKIHKHLTREEKKKALPIVRCICLTCLGVWVYD